MSAISRLRSLYRNLLHRPRVERDLDDEVRGMFEMLVEEKMTRGMPHSDARRAAVIEMGRVESIKDHVRDVRAGALWDAFVQDVRYGGRLLWHNPLFTLTATLSLAICIGANAAVFSVVNRLLFRDPTGVPAAGQLIDVAPTRADGRYGEPVLPYDKYVELRDRVTTLEEVYGYQLDIQPVSLGEPGGAERIFSTFVTSNYFAVLGIRPGVGRLFDRQDSEEAGGSDVVILSHRFWSRRFDQDPAAVGQVLRINGRPLTIVGVTPEGFQGLSLAMVDVWITTSVAAQLSKTGLRAFAVGGRLKPGVRMQQAAAEVDAIGRALLRDMQATTQKDGVWENFSGGSMRVVAASPIPAIVRVVISGFLALLMGIVSLVLFIACANVVTVLLARATARRREIAVRLAIGAGRARLVRQLLTETLLLFVLGGTAGLVLARVMTSLIVLALPPLPVPVDTSLPLDLRVIAFTALLSLVAALLSGLVPALRTSKSDVVSALKADAQGPSDRLRLRSLFVVAQIAFSILLVVGAGLFARALHRAGSIDLGFDSQGIEVAALDLSLAGYSNTTGPFVVQELLDRIRSVPGVVAASAATTLPLGGQHVVCCGVSVPGVAPPDGQQFFQPSWNLVEPGYFATLKIPITSGRDFTAADRSGTEPVAIVSAAAARQFWPGRDAVREHFVWHKGPLLFSPKQDLSKRPGVSNAVPMTRVSVIGVAADVNPSGGRARPLVYVPLQQHYQSDLALVARSSHGQRLTAEIRDIVSSTNPSLPIIASSRLGDQTSPVLMQLRIAAWVSTAVGLIAVLLAAIGIYGVTAYAVTRRTREIGIRVAMGAQRREIVGLVLRQGMALVLVGGAVGLLLAAGASRLLVRMLFGIPPLDPLTFGTAALLFTAIGLTACWVPVRRATRINAVDALRSE